jgi:phosphoribosyl 1,2-cyclic phosphate phosphodiesterase
MKIQFLGTAAAEGVPALFCNCPTCVYSRKHGGRNVRTRSQALIDDVLLIDMGPDALLHEINLGLDFTRIENCLITHVHFDHFQLENFQMRQRGYANMTPDVPALHVWGSRELYEKMVRPTTDVPLPKGKEIGEGGRVNRDDSVFCHAIEPLTPVRIGDHEVVALPACHGTREPYNYIVRNVKENKALLYAHDTSLWVDERVWQYFDEVKPHLDLVSMDCTSGNENSPNQSHHMCFIQNLAMRDKLKELGLCDEKTVFISNHFSHNGTDVAYDVFSKITEEKGVLTSYDGMSVTF